MSLKTLTILESNQLLDQLLRDNGTLLQKRRGIRNYLIGCLMLDAGLRVGEVTLLECQDLIHDTGPVQNLVIRGQIAKGGRERVIPTTQRLRRAIEKTSLRWWTNLEGVHTTFACYDAAPYRSMSTRQIQRIIQKAGVKAIGRKIHPHQLRHTFATRLMNTCSIRIVQELLGHANLASTQIYTHPDQEAKKQAIEKLEAAENNSNSQKI